MMELIHIRNRKEKIKYHYAYPKKKQPLFRKVLIGIMLFVKVALAFLLQGESCGITTPHLNTLKPLLISWISGLQNLIRFISFH